VTGTLHLVSTPIGNMGDLSPRAREVLAAADLLLAEDTRVARRLLAAAGIETRARIESLRRENETRSIPGILSALAAGSNVVYASDAGTPCVSDPPARLVAAAHAVGARVVAVPGPSAVTAAVALSGLVTGPFRFEGFLPPKGAKRGARLAQILRADEPTVLFESPHRVLRLLSEIAAAAPARRVAVCRETTKVHEETRVGTAAEVASDLRAQGEFVVVVGRETEAPVEEEPPSDCDTASDDLP